MFVCGYCRHCFLELAGPFVTEVKSLSAVSPVYSQWELYLYSLEEVKHVLNGCWTLPSCSCHKVWRCSQGLESVVMVTSVLNLCFLQMMWFCWFHQTVTSSEHSDSLSGSGSCSWSFHGNCHTVVAPTGEMLVAVTAASVNRSCQTTVWEDATEKVDPSDRLWHV